MKSKTIWLIAGIAAVAGITILIVRSSEKSKRDRQISKTVKQIGDNIFED